MYLKVRYYYYYFFFWKNC